MTAYDRLVYRYSADLPGGDLFVPFWSGTDLAAKYLVYGDTEHPRDVC